MSRKQFVVPAVAAAFALALACSKQSPAPTSPSTAALPGAAGAAADGSTLKVPAPTLVSPLNDVKLDDVAVLKANAVAPTFGVNACSLSYDFEVYDPAGVKVATEVVSSPTWTVTGTLAFETRHTWRVRGACLTSNPKTYGPWSSFGSFISSTGGFLHANEVYDPLINGKTVGQIHGPVTFIPGVGVRLETEDSWITYPLTQTNTAAEYSMIFTGVNIRNNIEDPKNSIMAMSRDDGSAFNDNKYRMSVDVRGNGAIAFRFITGNNSSGAFVDTVGAERQVYGFKSANTYFVRATWDGSVFNVNFKSGGADGADVYNFGKPYKGAYAPNPWSAFLGRPWTPGSRDAPSSYDGLVARQVWISNRPRPASANK